MYIYTLTVNNNFTKLEDEVEGIMVQSNVPICKNQGELHQSLSLGIIPEAGEQRAKILLLVPAVSLL
jgi:hypothetical protein